MRSLNYLLNGNLCKQVAFLLESVIIMQKFTDDEKIELLRKAREHDLDINISGWFEESGSLNGEMIEDLDLDKLSEPINWDIDEIVDYNPNTITYGVTNDYDPSQNRENLSKDELFEYLDKLLTK